MNLHYVGEVADWEALKPAQRNHWQQLAAHTNGRATPGNMVSVAGLLLVFAGIAAVWLNHEGAGLALIAVGRFADVLDGVIADKTGTKSSLGEVVDAGCDKLAIAAALVLVLAKHIVPLAAVGLIGAQNLLNAAVSGWAKAHGNGLHPNLSGKLAAVFEWAAIALYLLDFAYPHAALRRTALLAFIAFVAFGYAASAKYLHATFFQRSGPRAKNSGKR